jgi:hypothetical protein
MEPSQIGYGGVLISKIAHGKIDGQYVIVSSEFAGLAGRGENRAAALQAFNEKVVSMIDSDEWAPDAKAELRARSIDAIDGSTPYDE